MISLQQAKTVSMKQCRICFGQLLVDDTFCRWCGVQQKEVQVTAAHKANWFENETGQIETGEKAFQSPSKQLLEAMAKNAAAKTESLQLNSFGVFVVASVIAIPMWLLIILLSPLDAYMSAKAASSRMNIQ